MHFIMWFCFFSALPLTVLKYGLYDIVRSNGKVNIDNIDKGPKAAKRKKAPECRGTSESSEKSDATAAGGASETAKDSSGGKDTSVVNDSVDTKPRKTLKR